MDLIAQLEAEQISALGKDIPDFKPGDTIRVGYKVTEGTRSRDGRMLPFKKGIWHLAVQTGLPVVPVVVSGAHRAWTKGSMALQPTDVEVRVLPAIDTSGWGARDRDEVVAELQDLFVQALPADQRPAEADVRAAV